MAISTTKLTKALKTMHERQDVTGAAELIGANIDNPQILHTLLTSGWPELAKATLGDDLHPIHDAHEAFFVQTKKGDALLHVAAQAGPSMLETALRAGVYAGLYEMGSAFSGTPLMIAAQQGDLKSVKLLLRAGADPDQRLLENPGRDADDVDRWCTAMTLAAREGHVEVVEFLIDAGADATLVDTHALEGRYPFADGALDMIEEASELRRQMNIQRYRMIEVNIDGGEAELAMPAQLEAQSDVYIHDVLGDIGGRIKTRRQESYDRMYPETAPAVAPGATPGPSGAGVDDASVAVTSVAAKVGKRRAGAAGTQTGLADKGTALSR